MMQKTERPKTSQKTEENETDQSSKLETKTKLDILNRQEVEKSATSQGLGEPKSDSAEQLGDAFASFAKVLSLLLDKFGWPGTLGILALYYINSWMIAEQKKVFIDTYVLGIGIGNKIQIIIVSIIAVITVVIQKYIYDRKWGVTNTELERSRDENGKLQAEIKKLKKELNQNKKGNKDK